MSLHECPICVEVFSPNRKAKVLPCGHTLCSTCIPSLQLISNTCPLCRAAVPAQMWERLPDNYTVMETTTKEALSALAGHRNAQIVSNLQAEEREIRGRLSTIQRDIGEIVKRREELQSRRPANYDPAQYQATVELYMSQLQMSTQKLVECRRGENSEIVEKQEEMSISSTFPWLLSIETEEVLAEEPSIPIPEEYQSNPVLLRIATLQDQSNRRQSHLQAYLGVLSQLEHHIAQLAAEQEQILADYHRRRAEYADLQNGIGKSIESAVKERVAAQTYIEEVEKEVAELRKQRELMTLEKAELMQTIEREASDQMLAINEELQRLNSSSQALLAAPYYDANRHAYLHLLGQITGIETDCVERTEARIKGLEARLDTRSGAVVREVEALEGRNAALMDQIRRTKDAIQTCLHEKVAIIEEINVWKKRFEDYNGTVRRAGREKEIATARIAINTDVYSKVQANIRKMRVKLDQSLEICEKLEWERTKREENIVTLEASWAAVDRYQQNILSPFFDKAFSALSELNHRISVQPQAKPTSKRKETAPPPAIQVHPKAEKATDQSLSLGVLAEAQRSSLLRECAALQRKVEEKTLTGVHLRRLYAEKRGAVEVFRRQVAMVCFGAFTLALLVL